jgi:hypothetical protein
LSIDAALSEIFLLNGRLYEAQLCAAGTRRGRESGQRAFEADCLHIAGDIAVAAEPHTRAAAEGHYRAALSLGRDAPHVRSSPTATPRSVSCIAERATSRRRQSG